jgi:hypothetical protein
LEISKTIAAGGRRQRRELGGGKSGGKKRRREPGLEECASFQLEAASGSGVEESV